MPNKHVDVLLKEADKELTNVARKDEPSVLRDGSYHGLCNESWMTEVADELSTRCPIVAEILSRLLDCSLVHPERKLAPMCIIYNVIMFVRCKHLSRVQRINTILLTEGKATTKVKIYSMAVCLLVQPKCCCL